MSYFSFYCDALTSNSWINYFLNILVEVVAPLAHFIMNIQEFKVGL